MLDVIEFQGQGHFSPPRLFSKKCYPILVRTAADKIKD